jgi:formate dehydrogenase subunit gamma
MRRWWMTLGALLLLVGLLGAREASAQAAPPAGGQDAPQTLGPVQPRGGGDAPLWREVRRGERGSVSIPDEQAGTLVQSEGESWRLFRNGPYTTWAGILLLGMVAALSLFFALRGRIGIEQGRSGYEVERFNSFERFVHWLTATSFVVLALTGLNVMFGRHLLLPLIGKDAFAGLSMAGKLAHVYLGFAFMVGVALMFVTWVRHNIPNRQDLAWLAKGGGMVGGGHPSARKFNAGQKLLFWLVVLGGLSLSLSGLQLVFPFTFDFFGGTFAALNRLGFGLPTELSPTAEQQLATVWHGSVAVVLIAVIVAHIYVGSLGMEGAFEAMGTGNVDLNWAREHHDLWVEELERKGEVRVPAE